MPVLLDVTDSDQIAGLDQVLPERLDAVVNNAGIVVDGPVEAVTPEDLRRQLEVNVVGQAAVTQAVLVPVQDVVAVIERALSTDRPRARYPVGAASKIQLVASAVLPTAILDAALWRLTGPSRRR